MNSDINDLLEGASFPASNEINLTKHLPTNKRYTTCNEGWPYFLTYTAGIYINSISHNVGLYHCRFIKNTCSAL